MSNLSEAVRRPLDDDPGMNMTPMIDIVFQLIVFFLLTLRFTGMTWRLDAAGPETLGIVPTRAPVEDVQRITVSLFRRYEGDVGITRMKVGGVETIELPAESAARAEALERLHASIVSLRDRSGGTAAQIKTPAPTGGNVPHGDVIAVLDQMIRADLKDIAFQGARGPLGAP